MSCESHILVPGHTSIGNQSVKYRIDQFFTSILAAVLVYFWLNGSHSEFATPTNIILLWGVSALCGLRADFQIERNKPKS